MTQSVGLALSGGGARGLAHIGVLEVLEEIGTPIDMLAGTSMGGAVAAAYAAGFSAKEIEEYARNLHLLDVVKRARDGKGIISQEKIADAFRDWLGGDLSFDDLEIPLALTAVDIQSGEELIIRSGSVVDGILATTALPGIFAPPQWQGRTVVDGGVLNPVPFDVVREMGADTVIAVHTLQAFHNILQIEAPPRGRGAEAFLRTLVRRAPWTPMIHIVERSLTLMHIQMVRARMQQSPPDLMIEVTLDKVNLFDFDQIDVCVETGQRAALRHVHELIDLCDELETCDLPNHLLQSPADEQ